MNEISIEHFHENYTVKIVRYELYPVNEPTSWCVGYSIVNNNNSYTMYVDTTVPLDKMKTNEDVLNDAWENVKSQVTAWVKTVQCKSSLLNCEYKPQCLCGGL